MQVSYIMSDEAGIHIEPESDPFHNSNAPDLKHTNLSAKYLVSKSNGASNMKVIFVWRTTSGR